MKSASIDSWKNVNLHPRFCQISSFLKMEIPFKNLKVNGNFNNFRLLDITSPSVPHKLFFPNAVVLKNILERY